MEDDDYWNTSDTKAKAFNFDDDVLSPQEILAIGKAHGSGKTEESIFSNSISNVKTAQIPLSSLVAPKILDLILLAQSGKDPVKDYKGDSDATVATTLKRLTLGRSCSLHVHRSLKSKTELLDGAVAIGDGNAVLTVVLYLTRSLSKKLAYELLASRPVPLNHYISFLHNEGKVTELTDLLTMLGRSPEAAMYQYQHSIKSEGNNVDGLLRKLTHLMANHFKQPSADGNHTKIIADYVKLLEWQKHANRDELNNRAPLQCLAYCCANHWQEGAGNMMSPLTICQRQQISPLQYEWAVLNVHGAAARWDVIESLFMKKDWLGRAGGCRVPAEPLVRRLAALSAPAPLLRAALARLPAAEQLRLAALYKVHSVVIETFAKQKDRAAITNYKMTLNPQSEEYFLAENTLRDTSIKWKN